MREQKFKKELVTSLTEYAIEQPEMNPDHKMLQLLK